MRVDRLRDERPGREGEEGHVVDVRLIEEWRPVHVDDRYEVSNLGRVRSWTKGTRGGAIILPVPHLLTPRPNETGHLRVVIGGRNYGVHRLVLFAFVGPPPPGKPFGLHKNDDPSDNHVTNLRWGTSRENKADSVRNGTAWRGGRRRKVA